MQPADGSVVGTEPTFLVSLDDGDTTPLVLVSDSPDMSGAQAACAPTTPWQEPGKYTCQPESDLAPGTWYWELSYWTDCQASDGTSACEPQQHEAGPYRIVVQGPPPDASFAAATTRTVVGTAVAFDAAATDAASYAWDFGDGRSDSGPSVSHAYGAPGTYTVRLTVTGADGQSATSEQTIVVGAAADAAFSATPTTAKAGATVRFAARPGFAAYVWAFGDGDGEATSTPRASHAYAGAGDYTARLTVTDVTGATDTQTVEVRVLAAPVPGPPRQPPGTPPDAAALPVLPGPSPRSRRDAFYSQVASRLAKAPRAVLCWSQGDWKLLGMTREKGVVVLGFVEMDEPTRINLSSRTCGELDALHYLHQRPSADFELAKAVETLAHETVHTLGERREYAAECFGMQLTGWTAQQLGTSAAYGRSLTLVLWSRYKRSLLPDGYWSAGCRSGGPLDLSHGDGPWP